MASKQAKETVTDALGGYSKYSFWLFVVGLLLAISSAFAQITYAGFILVVVGIVVGVLNLNKELLKPALALLILGMLDFSKVELIGRFAEPILNSTALLAAPIALLIGLKKLYSSLK